MHCNWVTVTCNLWERVPYVLWGALITLDITLDVGLKYNILMCLSLTSRMKTENFILIYWRYTAVDEHDKQSTHQD